MSVLKGSRFEGKITKFVRSSRALSGKMLKHVLKSMKTKNNEAVCLLKTNTPRLNIVFYCYGCQGWKINRFLKNLA